MHEDLTRLGKRYRQLREQTEATKPDLHTAMRAAREAGLTYREIMELSGYLTIQQVRVICNPDHGHSPRFFGSTEKKHERTTRHDDI